MIDHNIHSRMRNWRRWSSAAGSPRRERWRRSCVSAACSSADQCRWNSMRLQTALGSLASVPPRHCMPAGERKIASHEAHPSRDVGRADEHRVDGRVDEPWGARKDAKDVSDVILRPLARAAVAQGRGELERAVTGEPTLRLRLRHDHRARRAALSVCHWNTYICFGASHLSNLSVIFNFLTSLFDI